MKNLVLIGLAGLCLHAPVAGQNYTGLLNDAAHMVSAGLNADPGLNVHADYFAGIQTNRALVPRLCLISRVNFPIFAQKWLNFDFQLGVGCLWNFDERWMALSGLSWHFSRTEDVTGRYLHSGFKLDLYPGYRRGLWAVFPHLGLQYQPWIHLKAGDYARQAFQDLYPDGGEPAYGPKTGWYYQNHFVFQSGLGFGYFPSRWQVNLCAGFQHTFNRLGIVTFPDVGVMPFYGTVNFGYVLQTLKSD